MKKLVYAFDIDGIVCTNVDNADYTNAQPLYNHIKRINQLYDDGHTIIMYTARGTTTGINWQHLTEIQLSKWKVLYHKLIMGKPYYDVFVDDKAMNHIEFFED